MRTLRLIAALSACVLVLSGCASNVECDGHACIGNWKRDMALGGTVVHCPDGSWSHGGGLGDACGGHERKK